MGARPRRVVRPDSVRAHDPGDRVWDVGRQIGERFSLGMVVRTQKGHSTVPAGTTHWQGWPVTEAMRSKSAS